MANEENLVSLANRTTKEKREIAIKGGKASGETRRYKKTLRELIEKKFAEHPELQEQVIDELLLEATTGKNKTKAFEVIRDTIGEKPTDKVELEGDTNLNVTFVVKE